jgi:hypothetical protein
MNTVTAKPLWYGALITAAGIAVVSVIALVKDWGSGAWTWAVFLSIVTGISAAFAQALRNRRVDRAAEQARASR